MRKPPALPAAGRKRYGLAPDVGPSLRARDAALVVSRPFPESAPPPMTSDIDEALQKHRAGRLDEAERDYRKILKDDPDCAEAWHLLGVIALQRGDPEAAEPLLEKAVGLSPNDAKVLNNHGVAAERRGKMNDAAARFAKAVAIDPGFAEAHYNHGTALQALGRLDDAKRAFGLAIELEPSHARAHSNLGAALKAGGDITAAIGQFRAAADQDPTLFEPLRNLCVIYKEAGLVEAARPVFDRALALQDNAGLRINQATLLPAIYDSQAHIDRARAAFEQGVDALLQEMPRIADPLREVGLAAFYLPYSGFDDRTLQAKLARLYATACPALRFTAPHAAKRSAWQPDRRLRVGFISKYLRDHTVGKLNRGFVRRLDRERFHVTTLTLAGPDDEIAREIAAAADRHVILPMDLVAARQIVADAKLDVLLFTDIGMEPFTYFLAFSRLAPVQCVAWGHPVTSGLESVDYFLSNPDMDPPGSERHYTERLVRLPHFTSHYRRPAPPAPSGRDGLGLAEQSHLYVCPQSLFKMHPAFDQVLAGILRSDPKGEIILLEGRHQEWRQALERRFAAVMPDVAGRVRFLPRLPIAAFFDLLAQSDVMLDPTPFCGGNTTLEALAVGTPVVTIPGTFLRGRLTYAIYRQMGVSACIASDLQDYVAIAVRLGTDPAARSAAVMAIEETRDAVFEDDRIVGELEDWFVSAVTAARDAMG
jgi:protein O-GlcNAc transferase